MRISDDQRVVIEECVGRRGEFPPGAVQWLTLRKVLVELLFADAADKGDDLHYEADLID